MNNRSSTQARGSALDRKVRREVMKYLQPEKLAARLRKIEEKKPTKRIYAMGCGRSGTWLLTGILSTFKDVSLLAKEVHYAHFGVFTTAKSALVMKRSANAYETIEEIPEQITIVSIVRHPFDVLTSHNPSSGRRYHISPGRWLGEMLALEYLLDSKRDLTKILRYEDMVADPDAAQSDLGQFLDLTAERPAHEFTQSFKPPKNAVAGMHGIRKIDTSSVGRWKNDPANLEYLKGIRPRLGRTLDWVAQTFDYDIAL